MTWWRFWGRKDKAEYLVRNAGPGKGIETPIQMYVGPSQKTPLEHMVKKRDALKVKLPQLDPNHYGVRIKARKIAARYGEDGAAKYLEQMANKHAEVAHQIKAYNEAIAKKRKELGL